MSQSKLSSGGCGSRCHAGAEARPDNRSRSVLDKVAQHPCYSSRAHHQFARMHLAVAPACNIQCHYCNRKFDCSNESRPGVVSELLTPEQAVYKAKAVAAAIPQLSVIGIAGPGDPLANREATLNTLEGLRSQLPDVKLCLSTNGLMLPQHLEALTELGVDHVTITINAMDADIASQIYDWVYFNGQRYRGREAGQLLIDQQQEGLRKLIERGVLVKINSVLIPGINDQHLPEVCRAVRDAGAFVHNIMPLIARPEHGTYFGLHGQAEPTSADLAQVRQTCAQIMPQMSHCHQCRADAIGMLGEDRSQEFRLRELPVQSEPYQLTMQRRTRLQAALLTRGNSQDASLVAVATQQGEVVDLHFGHAKRFQIYAVSDAGCTYIGERRVPPYCHGKSDCDEDQHEDQLMDTLALLADLQAVFCSRVGMAPWQRLEEAGIQPVTEYAWQSIPEALSQWWQQQARVAGCQGVA